MKMDRRGFFRLLGGATLLPILSGTVFPKDEEKAGFDPEKLVIVEGDDPEEMVYAGLEALGGLKKLIRKGARVLIKPNIAWARREEFAANTNPAVVAGLVKSAFRAGAGQVYVLDRPVGPANMCYKVSGIEDSARRAGARVLMVREEDFVPVKIPGGRELKEWSIHKLVFDVDVVINVPIAKHHGLTHLTLGMKNIMGVIGGNRGQIHTNIGEKLTDLNSVIPVHLTVVDAYRILLRNGPQGGRQEDVKLTKKLIMGADRVAVDAFATTLFEMEWEKIPYIKAAHERGLGEGDFTKKEIIKVKV